MNLAVVEVFMRKEKMPYLVDDDAAVEASELLQQPTEDEITTFMVE